MTLSVHVKKALKLANPEATKARLSEGRQWIGIKNLEAPDEVQPRAGIDKDWVSQLATFRREGSEFPPARAYQLPDGRLILAEGHHRRWALLGENEADMLCDVVDGTMEEAIVYAAGSNKSNGVKPMSPKDVTKALEMLLAVDKWWHYSNQKIADHVGCSCGKVFAIMTRISRETGKEIPRTKEAIDGSVRNNFIRHNSRQVAIYKNSGQHFYRASYKGNRFFGSTQKEVREKLQLVFSEEDKRVNLIAKVGGIIRRHGFKSFNWNGKKYPGITGHYSDGIVAIPCDFKKRDSLLESVGSLEFLLIAIGKSIAGRQKNRQTFRSVIVCYRNDGPKEAIELFEQAGYEFMTPDELIASLGPVIPEEVKNEQ